VLVVRDHQQSGVIGVDSLNYRSVNISSSTLATFTALHKSGVQNRKIPDPRQ